MPKIHLPMQFSTEGAGKMGKLYRTWVSFKVAVEVQRHIWSDDRLQEFDKWKVSDSKNKISVTFLRPLWQGKVLVCYCTPSFCFHRLKIASPLTNFPLHFSHFSPHLRKMAEINLCRLLEIDSVECEPTVCCCQ